MVRQGRRAAARPRSEGGEVACRSARPQLRTVDEAVGTWLVQTGLVQGLVGARKHSPQATLHGLRRENVVLALCCCCIGSRYRIDCEDVRCLCNSCWATCKPTSNTCVSALRISSPDPQPCTECVLRNISFFYAVETFLLKQLQLLMTTKTTIPKIRSHILITCDYTTITSQPLRTSPSVTARNEQYSLSHRARSTYSTGF